MVLKGCVERVGGSAWDWGALQIEEPMGKGGLQRAQQAAGGARAQRLRDRRAAFWRGLGFLS